MKTAEPDAIAVLAAKKQIIQILAEDKWASHEVLFAHRHQYDGVPTPPAEFHEDLVADFWSTDQYTIRLAFRGSAKSTLGEEDIVLAACLMAHRNIVIISSNETRAAERLAAVAYELMNNPWIQAAFGDLKGDAWTQTKLVTTTGVCIQAIGRDQDIRGIKHLDHRPDFIFVDDVESPDSVQTPDQRRKTLRWFLSELLPACAPNRKVRIRATPMDAESLPVKLEKEWGWPCQTYPVEYLGEDGKRKASWPEVWPLSKIDRERQGYERVGELAVWEREMLCRAFSESDRIFTRDMIRVAPRERTWQACYAMIDPARTVGSTSATTGWAVWSWVSNRLVVWAADAQFLLPDEIVALAFDIAERYDPVWVGVELDGLEQFLLQPLRHEMVRRGTYLPVRGVRAPRGKLDFIRGLQPFFAARECEFAQPLPALTEQLLNYPTGKIDAPNALAYALQMRPGLPVYEGFGADHIVPDLEHDPTRPLFLVANATGSMTAAVLCQFHDGRLLLLRDWVREGNPGELTEPIYNESILVADSPREALLQDRPRSWAAMLKAPVPDRLVTRNQPPTWVVPPHHEEKYTNVGLLQAIRQIPADLRLGGQAPAGQVQLQDLLGRISRGLPAVAVSPRARWICRSLAGGYARALVRGRLQEYAEEGPYRLLMEGLESFMGLQRKTLAADGEDEDTQQPWGEDRHGNRYRTAMPARR